MTNLIALIQDIGNEKKYDKNEMIFHLGDPAFGFYYIKTGEVSVFKMNEEGQELEINRVLPNNYLGEIVLFASPTFPVYARAEQKSTLLYFSKNDILKKIQKDSTIAQAFLVLLAKKCLVLNDRIETLSLKSIRQRLIQYLFTICKGSSNCSFELPIKKGALAKQLGTINETLSRNFRQLQDEGLLCVKGKKIQILKCVRLRKELK